MVAGPRAVVRRAGDIVGPASCLVLNYWGPNTPFIFLVASVPLITVPYWQVPSPMFVPKRRSQQGVVGSRAVTNLSLLLETLPFIGPTSSLLVNYIPRDRHVTSGCRISGPLVHTYLTFTFYTIIIGSLVPSSCDESVSRGRMTGTRGRGTGTIGTKGRTEGTKKQGNEKPYGLVQIEYWDRGTSTRHVWTWRGRVTLFLDV